MAEIQGKTLAMPADGKMACCIEASRKNRHRSSSAGLSWYFAQRATPGPVHVATMYGYMGYGSDKTKGGKEDV